MSASLPLVDLGRAKLYRGNGLAVLPLIAGQFDAIISDPPYGIGYDPSGPSGSVWGDVSGIVGDVEPFDPCPLLAWSKPTVLFGANNFASRLPDSRAWFVWDKRAGGKSLCFSDCELAWCSIDGPARLIRYLWTGANRGPERGEHWHPTQKPIEVMRWIIETVTKTGDVVLDPSWRNRSAGEGGGQAG